MNGIFDAVRGCLKEEMRMDVIANNLANSTMIGFKKDKISFQDIMEQSGGGGGPAKKTKSPTDVGQVRIKVDATQGDIRSTGNPLDLAVHGKGFFRVETPEGVRYTRKGNFSLDPTGVLITQEGYKVLGSGGPITVSGNDVAIDGNGVIKVDGSEVGRIDLVDFASYDTLAKAGGGIFQNEAPRVALPPESKIQQGYVELSNVNVAEEMVQMIHSLRAFESYQKSMQVLDSINSKAINEVGRLK